MSEISNVVLTGAEERASSFSYENRMLAVASLTVGVVALDRLSVGYMAPYLVKAFGLTNAQIGLLYSAQALAAAVAGYAAAMLSDAKGWRKRIIVPLLALMSVFSAVSAAAGSFAMLLLSRSAMGLIDGPLSALNQSLVSLQSSSRRRGLNMGVLTLCMILIAQMISPIVITHVADRWSWRAAYLIPALPALVLALAAGLILRRRSPAATAASGSVDVPAGLRRNVWLCAAMSTIFMCWLVVHSTFLPLYLVKERGMTPAQMGVLMSVLGGAGCVGGLVYPALSDRLGRRPTVMLAMVLAAVTPLGVLLFHGPTPVLAAILAVGWFSVGVLPIYTAVIPGESVRPEKAATVIAMIMGVGELVGGVIGPVVAGWAADALGLVVPFWFTAVAVAVCAVLAGALRESGPKAAPSRV